MGSIVVIALVVVGLEVRSRLLHDAARAIDAATALERFRSQTTIAVITSDATSPTPTATDAPVAAPVTPPIGVYRYTTTGTESIDALGGATHAYPAETTLTVTPDGCGVLMRWDLLKERREEWRLCATTDGVEFETSGLQFHEFFGHVESEPLSCDHPVLVAPADRSPRPPVAPTCTLIGAPWLPTWLVVGADTRTVDGQTVPVMHVHMTITNDSKYFEHTTIDWWVDAHGLPVEMTATKSSLTDSGLVGDVHYNETYHAVLESLTPLR